MKKFKWLILIGFVLTVGLIPLNCAEAGHLEDIEARGVIRIGTTGDYIPMSYLNPKTGKYEGRIYNLSATAHSKK